MRSNSIAMNHLIYLDPGSGSYLVQALVAGALGVLFFFRNIMIYVRGFWAFLTGKKKAVKTIQKSAPEASTATDAPANK